MNSCYSLQLVVEISHGRKPTSIYSRKLLTPNKMYKTKEKEILSIVENLKEFHTILLGQKIKNNTEQKSYW